MNPTTLETEAPVWLESALDPTFDLDYSEEDEQEGTLGYFLATFVVVPTNYSIARALAGARCHNTWYGWPRRS